MSFMLMAFCAEKSRSNEFNTCPPYRQVKEWKRYGLLINDKNLLNWVIRTTEDCLSPVFEFMKQPLTAKSMLHVDET